MSLGLKKLKKSFNNIIAVDEISLSIKSGELIVLLGPSGCGKTTTLRLIAGLEVPDQGIIKLDGKDITSIPPQKRNVAIVFQYYALYPHRTIRGNIVYPLKLRGISKEAQKDKVENIASFLRISSLLNRKPRQLSSGEAQRVALARALVREPACFLLDEPISNLDAILRVKARAEIKNIQRKLNVTTLYVTHDQEEAVALADRIALMNKGKLVQVGTPEELFYNPVSSFVAGFLGKPPMNLIRGAIVDVKNGLPLVTLNTKSKVKHMLALSVPKFPTGLKRILVGLRPDDIRISKSKTNEDGESSWSISGQLEFIEGLKSEYIVHCNTPVGKILVKANEKFGEGPINLFLPESKAYYFDSETGLRIK